MSRAKTETVVLVVVVVFGFLTGFLWLYAIGAVGVGTYHWFAGRRFEREMRESEGWEGYGWRDGTPR